MDLLHYITNVGRCIHAYNQSITSRPQHHESVFPPTKDSPSFYRTEHSTQHKSISIKRCQALLPPSLFYLQPTR
jgi:hypothetical protein